MNSLLRNKKGDIAAVRQGYVAKKMWGYGMEGYTKSLVLDLYGFFFAIISCIIGTIVFFLGLAWSSTQVMSIGLIWVGASILGYVVFSKLFGLY